VKFKIEELYIIAWEVNNRVVFLATTKAKRQLSLLLNKANGQYIHIGLYKIGPD
jgi:hypothetical protein